MRYCDSVAAGRTRLLIAYFVTTQVAVSYLLLAVARRFRRPEAIERLTAAKHRKNAQRIEAAILRLRGLFIKVGQLISIMANFLPDAFREELERLQDQVPARPYHDIEARLRAGLADEVERETGLGSVRICADLFHMNIEEDDLAAAILAAGPRIAHVHVDDTNRLQPGAGHMDFASVFDALRAVGYDDWLTFECRLRGSPEQALPASTRFLAGFL